MYWRPLLLNVCRHRDHSLMVFHWHGNTFLILTLVSQRVAWTEDNGLTGNPRSCFVLFSADWALPMFPIDLIYDFNSWLFSTPHLYPCQNTCDWVEMRAYFRNTVEFKCLFKDGGLNVAHMAELQGFIWNWGGANGVLCFTRLPNVTSN